MEALCFPAQAAGPGCQHNSPATMIELRDCFCVSFDSTFFRLGRKGNQHKAHHHISGSSRFNKPYPYKLFWRAQGHRTSSATRQQHATLHGSVSWCASSVVPTWPAQGEWVQCSSGVCRMKKQAHVNAPEARTKKEY